MFLKCKTELFLFIIHFSFKMMHQIESSRHSSLLQYSETIVDESFDYDKKKDQSFIGTVGRIVLNPDKTDLAAASFTSGNTEVFLDITKYGILYDMVMVCDIEIKSAVNLVSTSTPYWDPTHNVYDLFETFELRTRSGHVLYERKPWTYMQEFKKCSFRRYKELTIRNMARSHIKDDNLDSGTFTYNRVTVPINGADKTKHRIFVPVYFDWFKVLSKCPDVMSLEDLVLVVRTKPQAEISNLFKPSVGYGVANAYHDKATPIVSFKHVYLRQYYIQPPQARYNAIVQSLHPGGQPHNNMTTCQFFERLESKPLTVPIGVGQPAAGTGDDDAIAAYTNARTRGSDAVRSDSTLIPEFNMEIHCQFPVYRTFIRAYWKGDGTTYQDRRVYGMITNLSCKEAGQTFYEIASGYDSKGAGTATATGNSTVKGLYETDILQEYDHGETTDDLDASLLSRHHERVTTINWSMAHLLPEQGNSKTAISFYQMANPTINFQVEFAGNEIPITSEGALYDPAGKNLAQIQTAWADLTKGVAGRVYVEVVHEYMCVFQTQASANMRNRSIRRMATK